jgi:hypothetical protein
MSARAAEFRSGLTAKRDQRVFLEAVSGLFPRFWDDLRETALPRFPAGVAIHAIRRGITHPALAPIRPAFTAWAGRFHIGSVDWLHVFALRTLRMWAEHPEIKTFDLGAAMEFTKDVNFSWDPYFETAEAFLGRVRKRVMQICKMQQRSPLPLAKHYAEWLVLHQFANYSDREIQQWERNRDCTIAESSVIRKGIKAAADRLGITPRKPTLGRPPKK